MPKTAVPSAAPDHRRPPREAPADRYAPLAARVAQKTARVGIIGLR